jgi:hypothetical protein
VGKTVLEPSELDLARIIRDKRPLPPVPYALKHPDEDAGPLVNGDMTILSSEGKAGKSETVLAIAQSFSTGLPFAGYLEPTGQQRCLYFDAENHEALITRRWIQLVNGLKATERVKHWTDPPLRYFWGHQYNLDNQASFDAVRRLIDEHKPAWLFFDTLLRFTRKSLLSADEMSELYMTRWRPLREMVRGGLILLAHLRKRSKEASNDPGQRLFGSVDLRNSCHAHIVLRRDGNAVKVIHEATRWDELFPAFLLRLELSPDRTSALSMRHASGALLQFCSGLLAAGGGF